MASLTWTLEDGQEQTLTFDATVRDAHVSAALVTEHPVERASNISDHVRSELDRVSLEVVVSDTPIVAPTDHNDGVTGSTQGVVAGDAKAQVLVFTGGMNRARSVYEELLELMGAGTRVNLFTSLREYEGMVLKLVSPVRQADSGSSLVATIELVQFNVVDSQIVAAPEPRQPRARPGANSGQQNGDEDPDGAASQSFAAAAADGLAGFFQ